MPTGTPLRRTLSNTSASQNLLPPLSFRLLAAWDPLPLWYTERLPPSLLSSRNSPTAEPFSGWDASWASPFCAQLSCASEVHAHPSTTQLDPPRLESPSTWPAQRDESLSKANYMNQTNSFSVPYCSSFSTCLMHAVLYCVFWESFFTWLTQREHIYIYDNIVWFLTLLNYNIIPFH